MKTAKSLCVAALVFASGALTCRAWEAAGFIYCDADQNGQINTSIDSPLAGVTIMVTNASGSFSTSVTSAADGSFALQLPATSDTYFEFVAGGLPAGAAIVVPGAGDYAFTLDGTTQSNFFGNFLVNSALCQSTNTAPQNAGCWLTGGGTIRTGKGKPAHSFGGVVYPACKASATGGNWNDVAHDLGLHFKTTFIQVVNCGNVPGIPPGARSPKASDNFIEFQGNGTLTGIGGNKANYGVVNFFAHAEDRAEPGHHNDQLYLRVYDSAGNTLLLISADAGNPMDVAPVPISTGNLQIHTSNCNHQSASQGSSHKKPHK